MKYTPRFTPIIEAYYFEGLNSISQFPSTLNVRKVPMSIQGICNICKKSLKTHAFIDSNLLCPNTYIINTKDSHTYSAMEKEVFEKIYKPLNIEEGVWENAKESQGNN